MTFSLVFCSILTAFIIFKCDINNKTNIDLRGNFSNFDETSNHLSNSRIKFRISLASSWLTSRMELLMQKINRTQTYPSYVIFTCNANRIPVNAYMRTNFIYFCWSHKIYVYSYFDVYVKNRILLNYSNWNKNIISCFIVYNTYISYIYIYI